MLIKLGFWTPVLFFLTLKSGFPETSSQLTPSSSGESCKPPVPRRVLSLGGTARHQRFDERLPPQRADPEGRLAYAGRAGTGISHAELERLWRRL